MVNTTNMNWQGLLDIIMHNGDVTSPRGKKTKELMGFKSMINMNQPVITIKERNLGYKFMAAEAAWIMVCYSLEHTVQEYVTSFLTLFSH